MSAIGNPCLVGGIDPRDPEALANWPNCTIPDCEHKQCTWTGTVLCYPHAEELLGKDECDRRYDATHLFSRDELP